MPTSFKETPDEDTHILRPLQDINLYKICKHARSFSLIYLKKISLRRRSRLPWQQRVPPPPPVAMATRGAAPFPPSPAPARRARGAPGASPARGRPSAVTRPRGGLCRGALPGRGSWGDTGAERGCGAGGGRRGPVRSGGAGQRDSAAPGSAGPAGRFKGREGCNKEGAGTAALIVCEMLFVHRPVIRIIWAVGISARFPSQLRACGHGAGCSVRGCWWDPRPGGIGGVFMGMQGCFLWVTGNGFLKLEIITLVVLYACKQLHGQCRNLNQI